MPLSVEEILASLGIAPEAYAGKTDVVKDWNGKISASETAGQTALADAQKKLADAESLDKVINDNIAQFGMNETNVAQLRANNAALTAALEEVKKAGFTGINIPDLPKNTPPVVDPAKQIQDLMTRGFTQMGATLNETNRYFRVFGKPLPEDPATLADKAAAQRLSLHDYMERTYNVSGEEKKQTEASQQKSLDEYAAKKVQEYKDSNQSTAGHPELNGGLPSNYPQMPKPRETKDIRSFAALPAREKIANAMQRATEAAKSSAA